MAEMMREGLLGGRDMLTGERWQPPPITAAQRQLEHAMQWSGVDEMQAVLDANPGMDVDFFSDESGFNLMHMAVRRRGLRQLPPAVASVAPHACHVHAPALSSQVPAPLPTLPTLTLPPQPGDDQPAARGSAAAAKQR